MNGYTVAELIEALKRYPPDATVAMRVDDLFCEVESDALEVSTTGHQFVVLETT